MSYKNVIGTMVEYHVVSNRRLWEHVLEHVTDEQFTLELGYSLGSLRHQFMHLAATDHYWLHDIQVKPVTGLDPADYPTRESFGATLESVAQALLDYVKSLTDPELEAVPAGLMESRWQALMHVVNHGTDHRAQILSMLHSLGAPTFEQDLDYHLRRHRRVRNADVLASIRFRRNQWQEALASIPDEQMTEPAINGRSIKDIVAHLTWYEREMVDLLKTRRFGGSAWWRLPRDERNQRILEQGRERPLAEVLQEHNEVHEVLIEKLEQLDDEALNDPSYISGLPPGSKLWLLLEENTWIHYLLHIEEVGAWQDRRPD